MYAFLLVPRFVRRHQVNLLGFANGVLLIHLL
jgi:hypothetical protein